MSRTHKKPIELKVDDYVLLTGKEGYVRYIGKREHRHGIWYGIQLAIGNGLNDGSEYGERYFACKFGKGIFVRLSAIKCKINPNISTKKNVKKSKSKKKLKVSIPKQKQKQKQKRMHTNIKPSITVKRKRKTQIKSNPHNIKRKPKKKSANKVNKPSKIIVSDSKKKKSEKMRRKSRKNTSLKKKRKKKQQKNSTRKYRQRDLYLKSKEIGSSHTNIVNAKKIQIGKKTKKLQKNNNGLNGLNRLKKKDFIKTIDTMEYGNNKLIQDIENSTCTEDYLSDNSYNSYSDVSIAYSIDNGKDGIQNTSNYKQSFVLLPDSPISVESNSL